MGGVGGGGGGVGGRGVGEHMKQWTWKDKIIMKLDNFEFQTGLFFTGPVISTIKSRQTAEASDDEVTCLYFITKTAYIMLTPLNPTFI